MTKDSAESRMHRARIEFGEPFAAQDPPPHIPVEPFTDRVVARLGGCRVTDLLTNEHLRRENADYYFKSDHVVVELKEVAKDHFGKSDRPRIAAAFKWAVGRGAVPRAELRAWENGQIPLPNAVMLRMLKLFRRSMEGTIRKARSQIATSLRHLEGDQCGRGLLLLVNEGNYFLPMMGQSAMVEGVLLESYSAWPVEGLVYTSVNIGVTHPDTELDVLPWSPKYRDNPPDPGFHGFVNRFGAEFQRMLHEETPTTRPPVQTEDGSSLQHSRFIRRDGAQRPSRRSK